MCRVVFEISTPAKDHDTDEKPQSKDLTMTASSLPVNHFSSIVLNPTTAAMPSLIVGKGFADPNHVICECCEDNQATEYCNDCSTAFCGNCKKAHLKPKTMAHHQFITLDEAMKPESDGSSVEDDSL